MRKARRVGLWLWLLAASDPLAAQSLWSGAANNDLWSNPQNWHGSAAPVPGPTTWLGFEASSRLTPTADTNVSAWVVNRIDFGSRASLGNASFTLSGAPLSFQGSNPSIRIFANVEQTLNNDIGLPSSDLTINGWSPVRLNGALSGTGGLIAAAPVILRGDNSYSGPTQVGASPDVGSILLMHPNGLGHSIKTTVNLSSSLTLAGGISVEDRSLVLARGQLGNTSGNNRWAGDVTISGRGTISAANAAEKLEVSGEIDGQDGALSVTGAGEVVLSGTVRNLTQWGISRWGGGTLTLSGTTVNVPNFDIPDGTLNVAASTAIPPSAFVQLNPNTGNVHVPAYPTLMIQQDTTIGGLSCNSSDLSSGGIATVQLGSHRLTVDQSFYSAYRGTIAGTGQLVKDGVGTLELSGANSFTGGAVVRGGVLAIQRPDALGPLPATPTVNLTLDGGAVEARAVNASFLPAPMTLEANRTVHIASQGTLISQNQPFTVASRVTGPGALVVSSPARIILSHPANDFSGGTTVVGSQVQFGSVGSMGTGTVKLTGRAAAIAGHSMEQAFLHRIDPASDGVVMLGMESAAELNFEAAGLTSVSLDAVAGARFYGRLTGSIYRLGGAAGSNFVLASADALSGSADLEIVADAQSAGAVTFANSYTIDGRATVRSGTLAIGSASTFRAAAVEIMQTGICKLEQSTLAANTITIQRGAVLTGCGTIEGDVVNHGTIVLSSCGLEFTGSVTNHGTVTVLGEFAVRGAFVNHGVLDLINSNGAQLPAGFVNNGVVYDAMQLPPLRLSRSGPFLLISIDAFLGHSYVLQRSASPSASATDWQDVTVPVRPPAAQSLTFNAYLSGTASFYRIKILP